MKTNRINYVIVGLFVIAMIASLLGAVAVLTGRTGDIAGYHTLFDNVGGVKNGTQVLYEGYPVGQVDAIRPVREGSQTRFRVELSLTSDWQIPKDSIARLTAPGLLAAITINIQGGVSGEMLEEGDLIPSIQGGDVFAIFEDVASEVLDLSQNSIKPLLDNVNRFVETFGAAGEPAMVDIVENLRKVVADLAETTPAVLADIESFSSTMDTTAGRVDSMLSQARVDQIDGMLTDLETTAANFAGLSGDLSDSRAQLTTAIKQVSALVTENRAGVGEAIADLQYVLDSLARHVDAVAYNLEGTSRNMFEFSRQVRQNPGVLIRGNTPEEDDGIAPALRRAAQ
jgi:phospholipid/cholesterol/gamma-HCH transport system substrate-binding protein